METQQPGQGVKDTGCTIKEKQGTDAHTASSQTAVRAALKAARQLCSVLCILHSQTALQCLV